MKSDRKKIIDYKITHINRPELEKVKKELEKEDDRGSAIIGHSFLEELLNRLLIKRFFNGEKQKEIIKRLAFNIKLNLCYSLQLINKVEKNNLEKINEIRNKFAHSYQKITFNMYNIPKLSNELTIFKRIQNDMQSVKFESLIPRRKYELVISFLNFFLYERIKKVDRIEKLPSIFKT